MVYTIYNFFAKFRHIICSQIDLFKFFDKYGNKARYPDTLGQYSKLLDLCLANSLYMDSSLHVYV